MSRNRSRPSSAASHSSRLSNIDGDLKVDCKAAYLCLYDDLRDEITCRDDLSTALQQTGRNPTSKSLAKYWTRETRSLTFEDFVNICKKEPVSTTEDLMKAFRKVDLNGDGYISLEELYRLMTTRGEKMSREDVKEIIDEVDDNKDGRLDYREFCNMMISTVEDCKKLSLKVMEKKERRKNRTRNNDDNRSSRRDEEDIIDEDVIINSDPQRYRRGSQLSIKSTRSNNLPSLTGSRQSLINVDEFPKASPRVKRDSRPAVAGKLTKLPEPRNLREWTHCRSHGCFYNDSDDGLISHKYTLSLPRSSNVWITIQPVKIGDSAPSSSFPADTALYVLRNKKLITFTEQRDFKGKYCVRCDLDAGKYTLMPFTTGCRLKPRPLRRQDEAQLVKTDKDNKVVITKAFRTALSEAFQMSDLDGNNLLSRQEFNLFNLRTSGEEVADDEWCVVEENVELENHEITKKGFIRLNEMEAEDNNGETDDLWVTLNSLGFNKNLELDQACPFKIDIYTDECDDADLRVVGLERINDNIQEAICESVLTKGESSQSKDKRDITLHTYIGDARATIVAENKSRSSTKINIDCSASRNCISDQSTLEHDLTVPGHTAVIAMHLLPEDERSEWSVKCE